MDARLPGMNIKEGTRQHCVSIKLFIFSLCFMLFALLRNLFIWILGLFKIKIHHLQEHHSRLSFLPLSLYLSLSISRSLVIIFIRGLINCIFGNKNRKKINANAHGAECVSGYLAG